MHQLHQREAAAVLQPSHVHPGAGGVQDRGHRVDLHRLRSGPAGVHRPHREGVFDCMEPNQGQKFVNLKMKL